MKSIGMKFTVEALPAWIRRETVRPLRLVILVSSLGFGYMLVAYHVHGHSHAFGFFYGLWHGMVAPVAVVAQLVAWVGGLFGVTVFEMGGVLGRPNTGFPYMSGFFLGLLTTGLLLAHVRGANE